MLLRPFSGYRCCFLMWTLAYLICYHRNTESATFSSWQRVIPEHLELLLPSVGTGKAAHWANRKQGRQKVLIGHRARSINRKVATWNWKSDFVNTLRYPEKRELVNVQKSLHKGTVARGFLTRLFFHGFTRYTAQISRLEGFGLLFRICKVIWISLGFAAVAYSCDFVKI